MTQVTTATSSDFEKNFRGNVPTATKRSNQDIRRKLLLNGGRLLVAGTQTAGINLTQSVGHGFLDGAALLVVAGPVCGSLRKSVSNCAGIPGRFIHFRETLIHSEFPRYREVRALIIHG
jgi:hypothetical protein